MCHPEQQNAEGGKKEMYDSSRPKNQVFNSNKHMNSCLQVQYLRLPRIICREMSWKAKKKNSLGSLSWTYFIISLTPFFKNIVKSVCLVNFKANKVLKSPHMLNPWLPRFYRKIRCSAFPPTLGRVEGLWSHQTQRVALFQGQSVWGTESL